MTKMELNRMYRHKKNENGEAVKPGHYALLTHINIAGIYIV